MFVSVAGLGLESGVRYEVMVLSGTRAGFPPLDDDWRWSHVELGEMLTPEGRGPQFLNSFR
jgi:hypothetical protein